MNPRIAAVIPCYRVAAHVLGVIEGLRGCVDHVFVVDDACPERSGAVVRSGADAAFVTVLTHEINGGVGAAVMTGYEAAASAGYEILVKVDGDGQMDPAYIPALVQPIVDGLADYAKGNRFFDPDGLQSMPPVRLFGNAVLSFLSKLSSGYWQVMDPTNGFTALHASLLRWLPRRRIAQRYFFESDLLFRLGALGAVVVDVPMPARYAGEPSSLSVTRAALEFLPRHLVRTVKRIVYRYFLRQFSLASVMLLLSLPLLAFGIGFGLLAWQTSLQTGVPATAGTIMLAGLPVILGTQMLLSFMAVDMAERSTVPLSRMARRLPPTNVNAPNPAVVPLEVSRLARVPSGKAERSDHVRVV